jgi:hypothetical protein
VYVPAPRDVWTVSTVVGGASEVSIVTPFSEDFAIVAPFSENPTCR